MRTVEGTQQLAGNTRLGKTLGQDVLFGRAVFVLDLEKAQRVTVRPAGLVDHPQRAQPTVLAAEPARALQALDQLALGQRGAHRASTRSTCAGRTFGSSLTQLRVPRHV
jgi:hypothetical protein